MNKLKKMVKVQQQQAAATETVAARSPSPDNTQGGLTRLARGRIQKDFADFENTPYYQLERIDKDDVTKYKMTIVPQEGMYYGGKWVFHIDCPPSYPSNPPKVTCLTQVYHPNIDLEGHVCLSLLRVDKDWSPISTFVSVADGLLFLFTDPNPNDPLNIEAGEAMRANLAEFERTVKRTMRGGRFFGKDFPRLI